MVDHILETHSMTKAVETKLKRANLALLIASWYPFASTQTLKDITYFVCWMYVVDDAIIDKVSWPGLDNEAAFEAAYEEILDFVSRSLNLSEKPQVDEKPHSRIEAINSFAGIGFVLCQEYTLSQRKRFFESCKMTMDGYRTEQQLRMNGQLPSWDEYATYREGSSCISMCVAMVELAVDIALPDEMIDSEEVQGLWHETVVAVWLTNDILSAKKELGEGFVENAVALLARETAKAQDGMDSTVQLVKQAIERFDDMARAVEEKFAKPFDVTTNGDRRIQQTGGVGNTHRTRGQDVRRFVESCKCLATGSLYWRSVSSFVMHCFPKLICCSPQSHFSTIWSDASQERRGGKYQLRRWPVAGLSSL